MCFFDFISLFGKRMVIKASNIIYNFMTIDCIRHLKKKSFVSVVFVFNASLNDVTPVSPIVLPDDYV